MAEQGQQHAALRQCESLEVEGLPSGLSSGEHKLDTRQNGLLCRLQAPADKLRSTMAVLAFRASSTTCRHHRGQELRQTGRSGRY